MGLLLAYFYERDQRADVYAKYGLMGLAHRGLRASYAVLSTDGFRVGGVDTWGPEGLPLGHAVVAAVHPSARLAYSKGNGVAAVTAVDGACPVEQLAQKASRYRLDDLARFIVEDDAYSHCAVAVLRSDGSFIVARGRESRRPLSIGGYGFEALYAATESAPINLMGGAPVSHVDAGEAIYGNQYWLERVRVGGERRTSLMEYVYIARPDSIVDGVSVYHFRREMGRRMARRHHVEVDIVAGVPETAIPYAIGYAEEKNARFEYGFISTVRGRTTLIPVNHRERMLALSLKLNPVPEIFRGKSVTIVDDSIVTGLTLKVAIQRLRRIGGVRSVHVAVSSPKIVRRCPFGVLRFDEGALIARYLDDETVERVLDADSVAWLPLGEAVAFLRENGINPCIACMGGSS